MAWRSTGTAAAASAFELLSYPGVDMARLAAHLAAASAPSTPAIAAQLAVDARYASYVDRQELDVAAFRKEEGVRIPADFDYRRPCPACRPRCARSSDAMRPATLAQASRMDGMTPAALMLLLAHLKSAPARKSA